LKQTSLGEVPVERVYHDPEIVDQVFLALGVKA